MTEYALYHGDEFVDIGTIDYLAKERNVLVRTMQWYLTKTALKRNSYILIKLEEQ